MESWIICSNNVSDTVISVSSETKARLAEDKRDDETWDERVQRCIENAESSDDGVDEEVLERLESLERQVEQLPDRIFADLREHGTGI